MQLLLDAGYTLHDLGHKPGLLLHSLEQARTHLHARVPMRAHTHARMPMHARSGLSRGLLFVRRIDGTCSVDCAVNATRGMVLVDCNWWIVIGHI